MIADRKWEQAAQKIPMEGRGGGMVDGRRVTGGQIFSASFLVPRELHTSRVFKAQFAGCRGAGGGGTRTEQVSRENSQRQCMGGLLTERALADRSTLDEVGGIVLHIKTCLLLCRHRKRQAVTCLVHD